MTIERITYEPELKDLLQNTGDAIADMFDQMLKGNWRDDLDHDVRNNTAMIALKDQLIAMMKFRAEHLDYEAVI